MSNFSIVIGACGVLVSIALGVFYVLPMAAIAEQCEYDCRVFGLYPHIETSCQARFGHFPAPVSTSSVGCFCMKEPNSAGFVKYLWGASFCD